MAIQPKNITANLDIHLDTKDISSKSNLDTRLDINHFDYVISRKEAAIQLGVTTRTIDRYITKGKLSSHEQNGRIWISESELNSLSFPNKTTQLNKRIHLNSAKTLHIPAHHNTAAPPQIPPHQQIPESTNHTSTDNNPSTPSDLDSLNSMSRHFEQNSPRNTENPSNESHKSIDSLDIYKKLYTELKRDFRSQSKKYQRTLIRIGYLESKINHFTTDLNHKTKITTLTQKNHYLTKQNQRLTEILNQSHSKFKNLKKQRDYQSFQKIVYFILFCLLLIFFPF